MKIRQNCQKVTNAAHFKLFLLEIMFTRAALAFEHLLMATVLEITVGHRTLSDQIFENILLLLQYGRR